MVLLSVGLCACVSLSEKLVLPGKLLALAKTCVFFGFFPAVYVNSISSPIPGLGVGLVVKGMWGDKCQVFDSPQASNPGGRMPGPTHSAALISHVTACLISVFSTEHWAKNSRGEEMWSR